MTDTDFGLAKKLNRAVHHYHQLDRTIKRYLRSEALEVLNDWDDEAGHLVIKVVSKRPPPPTCNVLIGDFHYNIRSALDYTACELVRANGKVVDEHVEFPIFQKAEDFRNPVDGQLTRAIKARIGGMASNHQAIIEEEQPFKGLHGNSHADPLSILYRLSNYDRHQFIHLTSVITNESFQNFTPIDASDRFEQVAAQYGPFKTRSEVARFRILHGPEIEVHVESQVRFDVAFDKDGPGEGLQVLKTLGAIVIRVGGIIRRF